MAQTLPTSDTTRSTTDVLGVIALVLLVIGGVNWGLVGLLNIDLVAAIFGPMSVLSRIVYILVAASAVYVLTLYPRLIRAHTRLPV
jgi:uncharacterized protein